jgi:amidohydrolase
VSTEFSHDLGTLLDVAEDSMIDIRRDLHQHPELSFEESRTSDVIRRRLIELDWNLETCPTPTGAVATLDTGRPGKTVMIRADIDALPVHEERELSYRSLTDEVMHACGHDVHTAALLGLADVIGQRRDQLSGTFIALFQPAEEGLGGARAMIDGGVLETRPVDYVIGGHVTSLGPVGLVGARAGIIMSEATGFTVQIHGKGGHGAMASVDGNVVLAVSALAPRLGDVITGLSYEGTSCACSAGVLRAGSAGNVVPRQASLRGTLRTFTPDQRVSALARLEALLADINSQFSVECRLQLEGHTPAVTNNASVTEKFMASAGKVVDPQFVWQIPPVSPSDDVAEFLNRVPGCYAMIGGALDDGTSGMHHSGDFAVSDSAVRVMAGVLASVAVDLAQE